MLFIIDNHLLETDKRKSKREEGYEWNCIRSIDRWVRGKVIFDNGVARRRIYGGEGNGQWQRNNCKGTVIIKLIKGRNLESERK